MNRARPLLVLVGGAPATGKSTLAPQLAAALGLPLLRRDVITHALYQSLDVAAHPDRQHPVLMAGFRVFYRLLADMLEAGRGVVAESNFYRGLAEAELRPLTDVAATVSIHCHTALEVSVRRFQARLERGEREWPAGDVARLAQLRAGELPEAWARAQPLDLGVPTLRVDTTDGYVPGLEAMVEFVRRSSPGGASQR